MTRFDCQLPTCQFFELSELVLEAPWGLVNQNLRILVLNNMDIMFNIFDIPDSPYTNVLSPCHISIPGGLNDWHPRLFPISSSFPHSWPFFQFQWTFFPRSAMRLELATSVGELSCLVAGKSWTQMFIAGNIISKWVIFQQDMFDYRKVIGFFRNELW